MTIKNNLAKTISVTDRIFDGAVTIQVNSKFSDFVGFVKKHADFSKSGITLKELEDREGSMGLTLPLSNKKGERGYVIWIGCFDWSVKSMGTLTHELVHFVARLFDDRGIPMHRENDEVFAYTLSAYQTDALWKLRKFSPKLKKKK